LKNKTIVFSGIFLAIFIFTVLIFDKASVEIAYRGVKATITGEGKTSLGSPNPPQSASSNTIALGGDNQSAELTRPNASLKISTGDESIVVVGNSGPISIRSNHAPKH
jgi:hypothetical protein